MLYLPTYQPTYLPTNQPTYLPTYVLNLSQSHYCHLSFMQISLEEAQRNPLFSTPRSCGHKICSLLFFNTPFLSLSLSLSFSHPKLQFQALHISRASATRNRVKNGGDSTEQLKCNLGNARMDEMRKN